MLLLCKGWDDEAPYEVRPPFTFDSHIILTITIDHNFVLVAFVLLVLVL